MQEGLIRAVTADRGMTQGEGRNEKKKAYACLILQNNCDGGGLRGTQKQKETARKEERTNEKKKKHKKRKKEREKKRERTKERNKQTNARKEKER